jgi:hypothetical protein
MWFLVAFSRRAERQTAGGSLDLRPTQLIWIIMVFDVRLVTETDLQHLVMLLNTVIRAYI